MELLESIVVQSYTYVATANLQSHVNANPKSARTMRYKRRADVGAAKLGKGSEGEGGASMSTDPLLQPDTSVTSAGMTTSCRAIRLQMGTSSC